MSKLYQSDWMLNEDTFVPFKQFNYTFSICKETIQALQAHFASKDFINQELTALIVNEFEDKIKLVVEKLTND